MQSASQSPTQSPTGPLQNESTTPQATPPVSRTDTHRPPINKIIAPSIEPRSVRKETSPPNPQYTRVLKFKPRCMNCTKSRALCVRAVGVRSAVCDPCRRRKAGCVGLGKAEAGVWWVNHEGDLYKDRDESASSSMDPKDYPPASDRTKVKCAKWRESTSCKLFVSEVF